MAVWLLTEAAERDLDSVMSYLAQNRGLSCIDSVIEVILDHFDLLAAHPFAFSADGNDRRHSVIPRMPYRITYRYVGEADEVRIMAVTHTRRRLPRHKPHL
ncbi:plasmid stabilization system protein ParE [Luteibacter sp. 621]|uniref:type II toxin-antitoxin system RelE/ParE family toxin n=1 Tax=Luteibacter sp. 621 TaxID=3373916 RepID=UPI003D18FDC1